MKWLTILILSALLNSGLQQTPLKILPEPLADRTFQFTRIDSTFTGTALKTKALVPNVLIVTGRQEAPELILQAGQMAFMLGQWTEAPQVSMAKIKKNVNLAPVKFADKLTKKELQNFNLIVLGRKNRFFKQVWQNGPEKQSFLKVVEDFPVKGRQTMFVSDLRAARYLANKRLFFKSGAYKGFFAFVKLRAFIEHDNPQAALLTLKEASGVHSCAKPVMLALSKKAQLPARMLQMAKKRNRLVFKNLKQALQQKDKPKARAIWQKTMETCYACHQGQDDVPRFRKFKPNEGEHGYHQLIAERSGLQCETCHQGKTAIVGY